MNDDSILGRITELSDEELSDEELNDEELNDEELRLEG